MWVQWWLSEHTPTHTHATTVWNSDCLHRLLLSPGFATQLQHCQSRSLSHSASLVNFSPIVRPTPNIQPCDLTEEEYSTPSALCSLPISPDHMPTVTAAYSTSISKSTKNFCKLSLCGRLSKMHCREYQWLSITVLKYNLAYLYFTQVFPFYFYFMLIRHYIWKANIVLFTSSLHLFGSWSY